MHFTPWFFLLLGLSLFSMTLGLLITLKRHLIPLQQRIESIPAERFYCYSCGQTSEHVQICQFEDGRQLVRKPLCFACAVTRDAVVLNEPDY